MIITQDGPDAPASKSRPIRLISVEKVKIRHEIGREQWLCPWLDNPDDGRYLSGPILPSLQTTTSIKPRVRVRPLVGVADNDMFNSFHTTIRSHAIVVLVIRRMDRFLSENKLIFHSHVNTQQ